MTLHLNFTGSLGGRQAEQQQQHIRDARKELKERVRNDWDYPTLPAYRSCGHRASATNVDEVADRIAGFRFRPTNNHDREGATAEQPELGFEPAGWRERQYSSGSDSESGGAKRGGPGGKVKQKAYKFDSPDSVGPQISERSMARKRKRQQALEEEMEWNDGLAHWMRRRDNWSCARTQSQIQQLENQKPSPLPPPPTLSENQDHTGPSPSSSKSSLSSPRTSTSTNPSAASSPLTAEPASISSSSTPISSPSTSASLQLIPTAAPPPPSSSHILIPLAPPLLPNNPIRRRISSNLYPDIYAKVILQSRAPSVPINLAMLVRALVQGWKDDGEWPPKAAAPEKAIGRKKGAGDGGGGSSIGRGVKAVGRVLRLTGSGNGHGHGNGNGDAEQAGAGKKEEG